jgi:hypothetical protein
VTLTARHGKVIRTGVGMIQLMSHGAPPLQRLAQTAMADAILDRA